jgi:hypothetical protein
MLRWLEQKALNAATAVQKRELERLVESLRGMDSAELGHMAAMVTEIALRMEALKGWDLFDPFEATRRDSNLAIELAAIVREQQRAGMPVVAAGTMVWLHTARGALNPELRLTAKLMWVELERGFEFVRAHIPGRWDNGIRIAIATRIPQGFDLRA